MEPLKQLLSIFGVAVLLALMYGVFSAFFTSPLGNQQLTQTDSGLIAFSAPVQPAVNAPQDARGTMTYLRYQRGNVIYVENLSLRGQNEVSTYFSRSSIYVDGPLVGNLVASNGNVTVYIPGELTKKHYDYLILVSQRTQQVLAFVNLTYLS